MIVEALLDLLGFLLGWLGSLPALPLLDFTGRGLGDVGYSLGVVLRAFPFVEWGIVLGLIWVFVSVGYPAILAYRVGNWIYKHLPTVLGTGPGAG